MISAFSLHYCCRKKYAGQHHIQNNSITAHIRSLLLWLLFDYHYYRYPGVKAGISENPNYILTMAACPYFFCWSPNTLVPIPLSVNHPAATSILQARFCHHLCCDWRQCHITLKVAAALIAGKLTDSLMLLINNKIKGKKMEQISKKGFVL